MFGIHLTNKRCRTNAVNFCFPSHCTPKDIIYSLTHSLPCWCCFVWAACISFHFCISSNQFRWIVCLWDVAHPSKSIYWNGIGKSRFIFHTVRISMMATFICIVLCWTSNDVDLLWFDQIAAVLQITLAPAQQCCCCFRFLQKYFSLDHFSFPKKGLTTKSQSAIGYRTHFDWEAQEQKNNTNREMNWIEYEKRKITIEKSNNILVGER